MNFVQEIVNDLYELFKVFAILLKYFIIYRRVLSEYFSLLLKWVERPRFWQEHIREANVGNERSNPESSTGIKRQQNAIATRANAVYHSRIDKT